METLKPLTISVVRTVIAPLLFGGLLQLLVLLWADFYDVTHLLLMTLFALIWYGAVHRLEIRNRYWGLLLFVAVPPLYENDDIEHQLAFAYLRTLTPIIVGLALTMPLILFVSGTVAVALQVAVTTAYYGTLRFLELRNRDVSRLIGGPWRPTY